MMSLGFVFLMLSILLAPGLAILVSYGIRQHRFLIAITFSYGLFAVSSVSARLLELPFKEFSWLVFAYLTLAFCVLVFSVWRSNNVLNAVFRSGAEWKKILVGAIGIILCLATYYFMVGPYTEIPADIYYHIEKFASISDVFTSGELGKPKLLLNALTQGAEVWYHLLAFVAISTTASTDVVVYWASLISMMLFLLSVYTFSLRLFKGSQFVVLIAVTATFLMAVHYGVTVFSYIRYYSFAPAMLAFVFYFYAVVLFIDILEDGVFKCIFSRFLCILLLIIVAILIHKQEALYIIIQLSVVLNVFILRKFVCSVLTRRNQSVSVQWSMFDKTAAGLVLLMAIAFGVVYIYLHANKLHFGNLGNRLLDLGPAVGVLPQLSILNPSYQFMQVVTAWGLLVYLLFFLNWRRYQGNLYLMAGMLLPLFTVFNPFFTDLFLRVVDSTVLWRFCFLLPIHYVAADLFIFYGQRIFVNGMANTSKINVKQQIFSILSICAMLALLLPMLNTWKGVHYSRYPTLKASNESQSYQHLQDVIDFLNVIPNQEIILTDPVTGYVLTGFTKHYSSRDKFAINPYSGFKQFTFEEYSLDPLAEYAGNLLVVNKRTINQGDSFVGALSRHWPTDLFKRITPFYTDSLLQHLNNNEGRFKKLYQHDEITIYRL